MKTDPLREAFIRPFLAAAVAVPLLAMAAPALPAVKGPVIPVNVEGSISSDSENIGFSGQMKVSTRIIDDPDFSGPTIVELIIDFSSIRGVGKNTGRRFTTEAQTIVHRPLLAFDEIEVSFPYTPGTDVHLARTANVVIAMAFNANSGFSMSSKISRAPSN
ncbi:MAG: hypothetical protein JWR74_49 [Polaromonas sp.]|nr:hypothetical protein [Polaromonas sp.]